MPISSVPGTDARAPAIDCRDLVVRYGEFTAVDQLTLRAEPGQVLALLGPNGAGKTSTVETLEGYRRATSGYVRVLGLDPISDRGQLVGRMGVMLQRAGVYPVMGPRRVLRLFASYYDEPEDPDELLDVMGLSSVAGTPWRRLSGGEQQRLSLALAVVGRPDVVFLDEPTAGVDPQGRIVVRNLIAELRARHVCVLLTTHELPEAERLADEVVIIAGGRTMARGTVAELSSAENGGIRFDAPPSLDTAELSAALGDVPGAVMEERPGHYRVLGDATSARVAALAGWMADHDVPLSELRTGRRSLEEVYLRVTSATERPTHDDAQRGARPTDRPRRRGLGGARGRR
jgi:ABC-2 type transport system ATP-binding protein